MRVPGPPPDDHGVPHPALQPIAIRLLVDPGSEPITGTLTSGDGPGIAFCGWLELASAIERSHEGPAVALPSLPIEEHP